MFLVDVLFALISALVLAFFFTFGLRRRGPWGTFLPFFLILFLAVWAIGIWIVPVGPAFWGGHGITFLIVGVLVAMLMTLVPQPPPDAVSKTPIPRERGDADVPDAPQMEALGVFFWALLLFCVLIIFLRYSYLT